MAYTKGIVCTIQRIYRIAQNFGGVGTARKLAEKTLVVDKTGLLAI